MPDSFGKRNRGAAKSKKFAAREERRQIRKERRAQGLPGVPEGPEDESFPEEPSAAAEDTGTEELGGDGQAADGETGEPEATPA